MGKHFIIPFFSIFVLVGLGGMIYSAYGIWRGIQARHWPSTTGEIESVESKDTSDSESSSRVVNVRYIYRVNGVELTGTTVHPSYGSSSFERAHRGLESLLHAGQRVVVYYDRANPNASLLSPGFYSCSLAGFFGMTLFFTAGLAFMATFWFAMNGSQDYAAGITLIN